MKSKTKLEISPQLSTSNILGELEKTMGTETWMKK